MGPTVTKSALKVSMVKVAKNSVSVKMVPLAIMWMGHVCVLKDTLETGMMFCIEAL